MDDLHIYRRIITYYINYYIIKVNNYCLIQLLMWEHSHAENI